MVFKPESINDFSYILWVFNLYIYINWNAWILGKPKILWTLSWVNYFKWMLSLFFKYIILIFHISFKWYHIPRLWYICYHLPLLPPSLFIPPPSPTDLFLRNIRHITPSKFKVYTNVLIWYIYILEYDYYYGISYHCHHVK